MRIACRAFLYLSVNYFVGNIETGDIRIEDAYTIHRRIRKYINVDRDTSSFPGVNSVAGISHPVSAPEVQLASFHPGIHRQAPYPKALQLREYCGNQFHMQN